MKRVEGPIRGCGTTTGPAAAPQLATGTAVVFGDSDALVGRFYTVVTEASICLAPLPEGDIDAPHPASGLPPRQPWHYSIDIASVMLHAQMPPDIAVPSSTLYLQIDPDFTAGGTDAAADFDEGASMPTTGTSLTHSPTEWPVGFTCAAHDLLMSSFELRLLPEHPLNLDMLWAACCHAASQSDAGWQTSPFFGNAAPRRERGSEGDGHRKRDRDAAIANDRRETGD